MSHDEVGRKTQRFGAILCGVVLVLFGVGVIINPKFYDRVLQFEFDYSAYNIPFGVFMIVFGIILFWTNIKTKNKE